MSYRTPSLSIISLLALLYSCKESDNITTFIQPVTLYRVESLGYVDKSYSAVVNSAEVVNLSFDMGGEVDKINVTAGDNVKKGEFIASIDPLQANLQLETATAAYNVAFSESERYKRLLERGAISQQQYEAAYANYIAKRSIYENAKEQVKRTKIYAPFSGIIERKSADEYQQVQPYQQIVSLINPDTLEVVFAISQSDAKLLNAPKIAYFVEFESYPDSLFDAKLLRFTDISLRGEGFPVVLSLENSKLNSMRYNIKVGYNCNVIMRIDNPKMNKFSAVPLSAIYTEKDSDKKYVWIYNNTDSSVKKREITTGELFGNDMIVVTSGVSGKEDIIATGIYSLTENQRVKVVKSELK